MRRVVREPFPDPRVRDAMAFGQAVRAARTAANISLESLDTAAACRTYNILMAEGRHVAAALIL